MTSTAASVQRIRRPRAFAAAAAEHGGRRAAAGSVRGAAARPRRHQLRLLAQVGNATLERQHQPCADRVGSKLGGVEHL